MDSESSRQKFHVFTSVSSVTEGERSQGLLIRGGVAGIARLEMLHFVVFVQLKMTKAAPNSGDYSSPSTGTPEMVLFLTSKPHAKAKTAA